jgi:hypothetical protein
MILAGFWRGGCTMGEANVMTFRHALALIALLVLAPPTQVQAQFGGMPGMPGAPGPGGPGFGAPQPSAPPPECQELLTLRDAAQKYAGAINAAEKQKATAAQACKLFQSFLAAEGRMVKALETVGPRCGVPPDAIQTVKDQRSRTVKIRDQVCAAAAQRPAGPSLSDALGTPLNVPGADTSKAGRGTYETLTGNPFAR